MSDLRIAAITQCKDEGQMLRRWVDHYGAQVGYDHLFVLDDGSTDGSTDDLPCTVHRFPGLPGDKWEPARMRLASGIGAGLLAVYDYVIFSDVDEFILADPTRYATIGDLLDARDRPDIVGVTALDLVHMPGEPPLDLARPFLDQRTYGKFAPVMCKPAVKRVAARWAVGSHGIAAPYAVDPDLYMVHLKFADRDRLLGVADQRHQAFQADGRAPKSGWSKSADTLVGMFDEAISGFDLDTVSEFDSHAEDLADVARDRGDGVYRTKRRGLWHQPLIRIPMSLRGAL